MAIPGIEPTPGRSHTWQASHLSYAQSSGWLHLDSPLEELLEGIFISKSPFLIIRIHIESLDHRHLPRPRAPMSVEYRLVPERPTTTRGPRFAGWHCHPPTRGSPTAPTPGACSWQAIAPAATSRSTPPCEPAGRAPAARRHGHRGPRPRAPVLLGPRAAAIRAGRR